MTIFIWLGWGFIWHYLLFFWELTTKLEAIINIAEKTKSIVNSNIISSIDTLLIIVSLVELNAYDMGKNLEIISNILGISWTGTKIPERKICGAKKRGINWTIWNSFWAKLENIIPALTLQSALKKIITIRLISVELIE